MKFPADTERFGRIDVFFFLAAFVFIYTQLFQFQFTPIYFDGDVMTPVSNALKMLDGEIIYKDFFHFIAPGADLYYAAAFRVFGQNIWVLNATILWLTIAQTLLLWLLSRKLLCGPVRYLPPVIFLVIGYRQFGIDGSYRLFSMVFVLMAVTVLFARRSPKYVFVAGSLCGLATFFVQTRGVLAVAGILAFVIWENIVERRGLRSIMVTACALIGSFLFSVVLTQSYFLWYAGYDNYYFAMVGFVRDYYKYDTFNSAGAYLSELPAIADFFGETARYSVFSNQMRAAAVAIAYYLLIPFVYAAFVFYWYRHRNELKPKAFSNLVLLFFVGICLAVGVSAPTANRLYQVAIPGLLIAGWLGQQSSIFRRISPSLLVILGLLGFGYVVQRQTTPTYFLSMPAGNAVFIYEPTYEKYAWMGSNTMPGDVVYEPNHPNFYFPFHLRNPSPLYMARDSGYTPAFQVAWIIERIAEDPPRLILWPKNWSKNPDERKVGDHMEPLWQFIQSNYHLIHRFPQSADRMAAPYGATEIWEIN